VRERTADDEDSGRVQPPAGQARVSPPANPHEPVAMGALACRRRRGWEARG